MNAYLGPRRAVLALLVFSSPIPRGDGGGIFPKPPFVCAGGLFGIGVRWGFVEVFVMPCVPIRDHPQIAFQFARKDDADDAPVPVSTFKRNAHGAVGDHPSKMQAGGGPEGLGLFGCVYFGKAHLVLGVPSDKNRDCIPIGHTDHPPADFIGTDGERKNEQTSKNGERRKPNISHGRILYHILAADGIGKRSRGVDFNRTETAARILPKTPHFLGPQFWTPIWTPIWTPPRGV